MSDKVKRIYYLDILKVIACLSVILIHTSDHVFLRSSPNQFSWQVMNFFVSFARISVPIFVMISGALFLNPDRPKIDLKRLYSKNILRLLVAYLFWIVFYAGYNFYMAHGGIKLENMGQILSDAIMNPMYHLWFVPMLIGIYCFLPVLQTITKNASEKEMRYILILFFLFGIVKNSLMYLGYGPIVYVNAMLSRFSVDMLVGYVGYFLLGHYIVTYSFTKNMRVSLWSLGIISFMICVVGTSLWSINAGKGITYLYEYQFVTTFFTSVAVFVLGKYVFSKINLNEPAQKMITNISNASFGIYLVHIAVLSRTLAILDWKTPLTVNWMITVIVTFVISLLITNVIQKIPYLKKYIV